MKGEAVVDAGRLESSLKRFAERGVSSVGPNATRKDQTLGASSGVVSDESLPVLFQDVFQQRRQRDVSDLAGFVVPTRRCH